MRSSPNPRRGGPPHNPGLGKLISRRRESTPPLSETDTQQGFRGWHERGYLPHRDHPGLIQLVTFRLADSFPSTKRAEWKHLFEIEDDLQRRRQLEAYLDKGRGACHLRRPDIAKLVEDALLCFHEKHYTLLAWVIMPNHVHAQLKIKQLPLTDLLRRWKSYTGREANLLLKRNGPLWARDYWDTYMRDEAHQAKARRYIENNPVKAGLVPTPKDWPWSSARFRDEWGQLCLPI